MRLCFFLKFKLIFEIKVLFISLLDLFLISHLIILYVLNISNETAPCNSHIWIFIFKLQIFSLSFTFNMVPFLLISYLMQLFSCINFLLYLLIFQIIESFLNVRIRNDSSLDWVLKILTLILKWQFIELSLNVISYEILRQVQKWKCDKNNLNNFRNHETNCNVLD